MNAADLNEQLLVNCSNPYVDSGDEECTVARFFSRLTSAKQVKLLEKILRI